MPAVVLRKFEVSETRVGLERFQVEASEANLRARLDHGIDGSNAVDTRATLITRAVCDLTDLEERSAGLRSRRHDDEIAFAQNLLVIAEADGYVIKELPHDPIGIREEGVVDDHLHRTSRRKRLSPGNLTG